MPISPPLFYLKKSIQGIISKKKHLNFVNYFTILTKSLKSDSLSFYFILGTTLLVFLTLLEVVTTSYLVRHDHLTLTRRIDRIMRFVFPSAFIILTLRSLVF